MNPQPKKSAGFTLIEIMVIVTILLFLAIVFLQPAHSSQRKAKRIDCINNLKEVGLSYKIWGGDHGDKFPFAVSVTNGGSMEVAGQVWQDFQVMSNILSTPRVLTCAADLARQPAATNFTANLQGHISYFINPDASDTHPQALLSGDDNLTLNGTRVPSGMLRIRTAATLGWTADRHMNCGNISLADGSVQQVTPLGLANATGSSDSTTNQLRLALP